MKRRNSDDPDFFEKNIMRLPFSGCWIWMGRITPEGYAHASYDRRGWAIHRLLYQLFRGPILSETLDHLCRVRCCVNPWHLEQVTRGENVMRGIGITAQNARKTECVHGHPLSGDNLLLETRTGGPLKRLCRICKMAGLAKWNILKRERREAAKCQTTT